MSMDVQAEAAKIAKDTVQEIEAWGEALLMANDSRPDDDRHELVLRRWLISGCSAYDNDLPDEGSSMSDYYEFISERIYEWPLSVEARSGWESAYRFESREEIQPVEYRICLGIGGPNVFVKVDVDGYMRVEVYWGGQEIKYHVPNTEATKVWRDHLLPDATF